MLGLFSFSSSYSYPILSKCHLQINMERTYIMIKPDGVQRGLIGEIVKRFEQKVRRREATSLTRACKL